MSRTAQEELECRPDYWNPTDPLAAILVNVKGQRRREMIADIVTGEAAKYATAAGMPPEVMSEVSPGLLQDELDDPGQLGFIHPTFLGGEFLPHYLPGEVEIARLVLNSSTMDVYSVRARRRGGRIRYRVVDEYKTVFYGHRKSSRRPLTEREMIAFIDRLEMEDAGARSHDELLTQDFLTHWWEFDAAQERDADAERLAQIAAFVAVESVFYPGLGAHYERQAQEWVKRKLRQM